MPRYICKVEYKGAPYYFEWSTIVDAPVTDGMSLDDFVQYYRQRYGTSSEAEFQQRMLRVERFGTSSMDGDCFATMAVGNRAGPNETELELKELIRQICNPDRPHQ